MYYNVINKYIQESYELLLIKLKELFHTIQLLIVYSFCLILFVYCLVFEEYRNGDLEQEFECLSLLYPAPLKFKMKIKNKVMGHDLNICIHSAAL